MDNKFYGTPCELCGNGIPRTGKRGRPPKRHLNCVAAPGQETITQPVDVDPDAPVDPDVKLVNEFLDKKPPKGRPVTIGMRDDRMQRLVTKLVKGDVVILRHKKVTVSAAPVVDGSEHVVIKFKGHDSIRVYKNGFATIVPRKVK